jgi:hypothetical protein
MYNLITVKSKENHSWSEKEREQIYILKDRCSAAELAKLYGTTVNQIHNLCQQMKKKYLNKCFRCGHKMTPEERKVCKGVIKACAKCKKAMHDYKSRLRNEALKAGKCEYCRTRKVLPRHTGCSLCLSATHRRRNLVGLCICGKEPVRFLGASLGKKCLKKQKKYVKERSLKR